EAENVELARLAAARTAQGTATLIGQRAKADPFWAALTNAAAGVALEVDEGHRLGGGHPAIHVVPGALAVAEERGLGGRRLLESLVAGYEIGSRIGGATTVRANVHSHGTWGTISTAVAVAKLGEAPAERIRAIINLAASMSPANTWTPALDGATIRNLYPGRSAFQGMLAVDLQRCGFTGLDDGPSDVYGTLLADAFDGAAAVSGIDALARSDAEREPYRIEQNYFKLHACCRFNHFALDAVMELRRVHRLDASAVGKVEIVTIPFAVRMSEPAPATSLAARFSIPWAVAAALVLGRTDPSAFDETALGDARIRDLARRVVITTDPAMSPRRVDAPTARVRVGLRDGRTLEETTTVVRGDALSPVPRDEITAKFLALASPVLGDAQARKVADTVAETDTLEDIRALTEMLLP
ncbi:MAG: 2-methylcitrate dehydratase, partial [Candidatus Rokuibacteriota bacterium]